MIFAIYLPIFGNMLMLDGARTSITEIISVLVLMSFSFDLWIVNAASAF